MDRDAYKERQKARRVEAQRHEVKLVLGKLNALLDQANRDGMLRQQTTLSPWILRGLVNSVRDLEAQLERAEAVGRQKGLEEAIEEIKRESIQVELEALPFGERGKQDSQYITDRLDFLWQRLTKRAASREGLNNG